MRRPNAAEQIRESLGIPTVTTLKKAHGEKMPQHTKRGPGRYHQQGRKVEVARV